MSEDRTRLERLVCVGLPHTLLEPIAKGGGDADAGVGELAFEARRLPETEWNAFLYLFRRDCSVGVIRNLRAWLMTVASDLYVREGWPEVRRGDRASLYVVKLCDMVLLAAQNPEPYQTQARRAAAFGVGEEAWRERLERPYGSLSSAFRGLGKRAEQHLAGQDGE